MSPTQDTFREKPFSKKSIECHRQVNFQSGRCLPGSPWKLARRHSLQRRAARWEIDLTNSHNKSFKTLIEHRWRRERSPSPHNVTMSKPQVTDIKSLQKQVGNLHIKNLNVEKVMDNQETPKIQNPDPQIPNKLDDPKSPNSEFSFNSPPTPENLVADDLHPVIMDKDYYDEDGRKNSSTKLNEAVARKALKSSPSTADNITPGMEAFKQSLSNMKAQEPPTRG